MSDKNEIAKLFRALAECVESEGIDVTLKALNRTAKKKKALFKGLTDIICNEYCLTQLELYALSDKAKVIDLRKILCFIAWRKIGMTQMEISNEIGKANTSVFKYCAVFASLNPEHPVDKPFIAMYNHIEDKFNDYLFYTIGEAQNGN